MLVYFHLSCYQFFTNKYPMFQPFFFKNKHHRCRKWRTWISTTRRFTKRPKRRPHILLVRSSCCAWLFFVLSRWCQLKIYFEFSTPICGRWTQFDYFFSDGLVKNHQLVVIYLSWYGRFSLRNVSFSQQILHDTFFEKWPCWCHTLKEIGSKLIGRYQFIYGCFQR